MSDSRLRWTQQTTLRLATPRAIREVLAVLGICWETRHATTRHEIEKLPAESGLYIWVKAEHGEDAMDAGGIYAGIGHGSNRLRRRLLDEYDDASRTAYHGHGIAVRRAKATVVAGGVRWLSNPDPELDWIDRHAGGLKDWNWKPGGWDDEWDAVIRRRLRERLDEIVPTAEAIAIRAAVYLGDVGFPVNSKMAGAWGFSYGSNDKGWEDGAAWAAVTYLLGAADSLPGEEEGGATSPISPDR